MNVVDHPFAFIRKFRSANVTRIKQLTRRAVVYFSDSLQYFVTKIQYCQIPGGMLKSSWIDQLPKIWSNDEISDDFGKPSLRFPLVKTVFKLFFLSQITAISGQNDVGLYNTEFLTDTDATYSFIFSVMHTYLSIKILFPCTLIILLSSQIFYTSFDSCIYESNFVVVI